MKIHLIGNIQRGFHYSLNSCKKIPAPSTELTVKGVYVVSKARAGMGKLLPPCVRNARSIFSSPSCINELKLREIFSFVETFLDKAARG